MNENFALPIQEIQKKIKAALLVVPIKLGQETVNFALDNFKRQAFLGNANEPWSPRKNPTKWGQVPKRNGRALLVSSGRLRRSIRITKLNADSVSVGSDVPYAKTHNEGLRIGQIQQVKAFTRKNGQVVSAHVRKIDQRIPARPFLKQSPYLTTKLKRILNAEILKALR